MGQLVHGAWDRAKSKEQQGWWNVHSLTFEQLRHANVRRIPQFKDKHGNLCHNADGSDWVPAQWFQALVGEVGEYANERKKLERGDLTPDEFQVKANKELADVQIYLDILAFRLGIDLGAAVQAKFNEVSRRVGADVFL
jgi:NTP pyrophosphatase (non-canonical NTP hydrolase)